MSISDIFDFVSNDDHELPEVDFDEQNETGVFEDLTGPFVALPEIPPFAISSDASLPNSGGFMGDFFGSTSDPDVERNIYGHPDNHDIHDNPPKDIQGNSAENHNFWGSIEKELN